METLAPAVPTMAFDEAKELTDQIRAGTLDLWKLIVKAHDERAWAALSYPGFGEYVRQEFSMSRAKAYRLLDYGHLQEALSHCETKPGQLASVELARLETPAEQAEAWQEAVEASDGKPRTIDVEAVVEKRKPKPKRNGAESQLERDRLAAIARAVEPPPHGPEPTEPIDLDDDRGDKVYLLNYHWDEATDEERSKFLDGIIQNFRLLFIAAIARAK